MSADSASVPASTRPRGGSVAGPAGARTALHGPLLVAAASTLWATDALFRLPAVQTIHPALIVFIEHAFALMVLTPLVLARAGRRILDIRSQEWVSLVLLGAGASAAATVLFTASFRYVNPSVSILIQKLQPVMCVIFARLFLGEHPGRAFYVWAALAVAAGLVISFPDLNFTFLGDEDLSLRSRGVIYALTAGTVWALATVAGKGLLKRLEPSTVTFWRFVFGFATLGMIVAASRADIALAPVEGLQAIASLLYMALIPGLLAMFLYYRGLNRTPASVATFAELVFPVSAVLLNTVVLGLALEPVQVAASAVLLFAVTMISLTSSRMKV